MIRYWKPIVIGLAAGLVGTALVLLIVTAWQDHQAVRQLMAWANQASVQLAALAAKAAPK